MLSTVKYCQLQLLVLQVIFSSTIVELSSCVPQQPGKCFDDSPRFWLQYPEICTGFRTAFCFETMGDLTSFQRPRKKHVHLQKSGNTSSAVTKSPSLVVDLLEVSMISSSLQVLIAYN